MRDKWYVDNRDLVKWGILLRLAERYAAKHILQVLYYRALFVHASYSTREK
jgi:hypothetical protein